MEFLNVNENKIYQTNILNTELIRTGSIKNGSCFFYSIYFPFTFFRKMSDSEKLEYIQIKRKELSEKINLKEWFSLQKGNIAFLQITETLSKIIYSIPKTLFENQEYLKENNIDIISLEILFALLNPNIIEKEILPLWDIRCSQINDENSSFDKIKEEWYELYKNKIKEKIENLEKKLDKNIEKMTDERKNAVILKLSQISYSIFDFVTNYSLSEFKKEINDIDKWLNIFTFYSVIEYLDIKMNIIIIDSETGMPYEGMKLFYKKKMFLNNDPFVLLLYFKQMHFECLGKKYFQNNKSFINRLFRKDDPFIITCLSYLERDDEEE